MAETRTTGAFNDSCISRSLRTTSDSCCEPNTHILHVNLHQCQTRAVLLLRTCPRTSHPCSTGGASMLRWNRLLFYTAQEDWPKLSDTFPLSCISRIIQGHDVTEGIVHRRASIQTNLCTMFQAVNFSGVCKCPKCRD